MTYDVNKSNLSVYSNDFNTCKEIPIDIDFSLPDYCPDIQKILKCKVTPNISSRNISGGVLNIEGFAHINLLYVDSDMAKIQCAENSVPFSCNIEIKNQTDNAVVYTKACVEYINCRAISPRKIDLHGALNMCVNINSKKTLEITKNVLGEDIEQKTESVTTSKLCGIGQQQFSISETLEIPESKNPPHCIICSEAKMLLTEYKIMPNKVVVKGNALVNILYTDDMASNNTEKVEYEIPISQIIDVPGVTEDCTCAITSEILSCNISIQEKSENSNNLISCEIKAAASVAAFENENVDIVSDVYSTEYKTEQKVENIELLKLENILSEEFTHTDNISIAEPKIESIIDLFADICSVQTNFTDSNLNFKGKINLYILANSIEGTPVYAERTLEFNHSKPFDGNFENIISDATAIVLSQGYSDPKNDNVNVKININLYAPIYSLQKYPMVSAVSANENQKTDKDPEASLTLYYATAGENVWDIARNHCTGADAIKAENNFTENTVPEDGMILIPSK